MDPRAIIESYVDAVIRHLPRKQRNDVGFELRSLLNEELDGTASDAGRPADEAMVLALLSGFGRPQDVADRYRPAGFTIIRPADAPGFARVALLGLGLQWALTLPWIFADPEIDWLSRLPVWWLSWGLGAFWWPGFLVVLTMIAAWIGHRWPRNASWTPPRAMDRDHVNRPLLALGMTAWTAGAAVLIALPWLSTWAPWAPAPVVEAMAFDDSFLRTKAPWLPPVWAGHYLFYGVLLVQGRWTPRMRQIDTGFSAAIYALLIWFMASGPVFRVGSTDDAAKSILAAVLLISLIPFVARAIRARSRIRPPKALAASNGA